MGISWINISARIPVLEKQVLVREIDKNGRCVAIALATRKAPNKHDVAEWWWCPSNYCDGAECSISSMRIDQWAEIECKSGNDLLTMEYQDIRIIVREPYSLTIIKYNDNCYTEKSIALTKQNVEKIIYGLNEAACNGAPWPVYEESSR